MNSPHSAGDNMPDHDDELPPSFADITRSLIDNDYVSADDYHRLRRYLVGSVSSTFYFQPVDEFEIVDAAIARVIGRDNIKPATALAYLRRAVRNEAVSRLRQRQALPIDNLDEWDEDTDAIARMLDASADAATVEWLLAELKVKNDDNATRVLHTALRLCGMEGKMPSARRVATETRLTHPAVGAILERCREMLRDRGLKP